MALSWRRSELLNIWRALRRRTRDPEGRKLVVVLVDNAGWHVARRLVVPPNVVLRRRPPCTPELQPAEPLWPLVREAVANEGFDDLEGL